MRRRVFDILVSAGGLVVVAVLVVAGALLMWGYSFTNSSVHDQLARQEIFFPPKSQITPAQRPYLLQYAGQQVLTGPQANAYAKKIASDIYGLPYHGIYAKLSAQSLAHPNNTKLAGEVEVAFKASTLEGLLLEAYAFGTFGTIAFWAGISAFILAFVMALLVGFGFWHARRVEPDIELLPKRGDASQ
jgi:hypothetical protein